MCLLLLSLPLLGVVHGNMIIGDMELNDWQTVSLFGHYHPDFNLSYLYQGNRSELHDVITLFPGGVVNYYLENWSLSEENMDLIRDSLNNLTSSMDNCLT